MRSFFTSHNSLIAGLSKIMKKERDELRKLKCEGHIYGLYVHLLNGSSSLSGIDALVALQEIDTLERIIFMDHYCYRKEERFTSDYRGEYPCRTTAIIIDISLQNINKYIDSSGCRHVVSSIIRSRLPLLDDGVYPEYFFKGTRLIEEIQHFNFAHHGDCSR